MPLNPLEEIERLKYILTLRSGRLPQFDIEIPQEHRKHGQHTAFWDGFEAGYRGWDERNLYEHFTAQYKAWDRGRLEGIKLFAKHLSLYERQVGKEIESCSI